MTVFVYFCTIHNHDDEKMRESAGRIYLTVSDNIHLDFYRHCLFCRIFLMFMAEVEIL